MARVDHSIRETKQGAARRLGPSDLRSVDSILASSPCRNIKWRIEDKGGEHTSTDLDAALGASVWSQVAHVSVEAITDPSEAIEWAEIRLRVHRRGYFIEWFTNSEAARRGSELAYRRLIEFLEARPRSRRGSFVEEEPPAWWDPRRPSVSTGDMIVAGVISGLMVALVALAVRGAFT